MTLRELLSGIADAIRQKEGSTGEIPAPTFAQRILAIMTGVDTSDATATAADMASGVTAYVDGEKVTGNVPVTDAQAVLAKEITGLSGNSTHAFLNVEMAENHLLRSGAQFRALALYSAFGDATAADVAAGKIFTSAAGLKVTGTAAASQKYEVVSNIDGMGKTSITIPCSFKPKGFILLPQGNVNKTYAASFSFIRTLQGHLPEYDISVSQEYNVSSATYFAARMYDAAYEELYFTIQYLANSIVITSKTYNGILFGFATMYQAIVFG